MVGLYIRKNDLSAHVDYADHAANLDTAGFHWILLDYARFLPISTTRLLSPLDYAPCNGANQGY